MAAISSNGTGGGNWSALASWVGGVVPAAGDNATIVAGDTITIDQNVTVGNDTATAAIAVNGILDLPHNVAADYILRLTGDLVINSGGEFNIADSTNSLSSARKFTVKTNDSGALAAGKYGLICNDGGKFRTYGTTKSMETTLDADVAALGTQITVQAGEYSGWKVGDQITIAVTDASMGPTHTEMRTIQAINAVTHVITLTAGVTDAHATGARVCLLSHNIIITSFNAGFNGYVRNYSQTKVNFHLDYTELTELGANVGGKNGAVTFYEAAVRGEIGHVSSHHNWIGLYFYRSDGNSIDYLNLHANDYGFIITTSSDNHTIGTVNCSSSANYGIHFGTSSNNTITTLNSYSNNTVGIQFATSSNNNTIGTLNTHNNDTYGVEIRSSSGNTVTTINSRDDDSYGVYLSYVTNSTFTTITINDCDSHGMYINYCSDNTFGALTIDNSNNYGLLFYYSANNTFTTLNISNSTDHGILFMYCLNNLVTNLNIDNNGKYGIYLRGSSKNTVVAGVIGEPFQNTDGDIGYYPETSNANQYSDITFSKSVKLSSPIQVASMGPVCRDSFVKCHNLGAVSGAHKIWKKTDSGTGYGTIESETTIFRTLAPSVRFDPGDANDWLEQVFNVPADANTPRDFSIYMRKDAAFNGSVELEVRFRGETIVAPVAKTMTTSFVEQTITALAASIPENGVLELIVKVKGTLGYVYADDFTWN